MPRAKPGSSARTAARRRERIRCVLIENRLSEAREKIKSVPTCELYNISRKISLLLFAGLPDGSVCHLSQRRISRGEAGRGDRVKEAKPIPTPAGSRLMCKTKGEPQPRFTRIAAPRVSSVVRKPYSASAETALAAVLPETKISTIALPPRRLPPWIPPVTSPAAYRPGMMFPSVSSTWRSVSTSTPPMV